MVNSFLCRLLGLICLVSVFFVGGSREGAAFGTNFFNTPVNTPNGGIVFFSNNPGATTAFVSLGGSGQAPGGAIYTGAGITPLPAITPTGLMNLGWLNVTILSQNGADATYATDGYMGVIFTAQETPGGQLFRYELALSGVTNTQIVNTRTPVDTTQPTANIGALTPAANGTFTATITLSEPSTDFVASDLAVVNATATLTGSGVNYVATLTPQNNGTIQLSVPAGVFTDAAGNLNLASNTVTSVQAATNTQRLIQAFQNARANSLVSNQPNLTRLLQRSGGGAFDASVTQGAGFLNFASNPALPVWFNITGNRSSQDDYDSSYALAVLGAHHQVNQNLLVGAMLQLDYAETENGASEVDGTGWLAGPYVVAKLPEHPVYFEGRALYGKASNEISPLGTYKDDFDSDRWLIQSRVTGEIERGALTLMPILDLSYVSDDAESYTDSVGNRISAQDFSLTTVQLGMDFTHPLAVSRGDMMLTGGLSGVWSSTSGTGTVPGVAPIGDTTRGRVDLGLDYRLQNDSLFAAGVFYDGIGESGFESYSIDLTWQMSF